MDDDQDAALTTVLYEEFDDVEALFALAKVADKLTSKNYWRALGVLYRNCTTPYMINHFVGSLFHADMHRDNRDYLMTIAEHKALGELPNMVNIYRGCWSANDTGWNYTPTLTAATAYARQSPYDGSPVVIKAKVHVNRIEAVFFPDSDNKTCIVVDPRQIFVQEVRKVPFNKKKEQDRVFSQLSLLAGKHDDNWQRLQFLLPVVQVLMSLESVSMPEVVLQIIEKSYQQRIEGLVRFGFAEHALRLRNELTLITAPTEEVLKWVQHFKDQQEDLQVE